MTTFSPRFGMGWRRDTEDRRDYRLYARVPDTSKLPPTADVERLLPAPLDQRDTNACVGFSACGTGYATMMKDGHPSPFVPSPVFLYQEARRLEGTVTKDCGAQIRDAWKAMAKLGMASITDLPPRFDADDMADPKTGVFPTKSIWRKKPGKAIYTAAGEHQMLQFFRLDTVADMLRCIADGYPFNIGITVFSSFYGDDGNPVVNVPEPMQSKSDYELGGHAVVACGYDMKAGRFKIRNSWGPTAHSGGPNFTVSFNYVQRYGADAWTGRLTEGAVAKVAA